MGRNGRRNHWLLVLVLVIAVTLLRWLLLVMLLLLLRMRSDLRMGWGVRQCHGNSRRLWRHRGLLQLLAWLDFWFCHGGSGQFLMAALPTALRSVLDLRVGVALGDAVSGLSETWVRLETYFVRMSEPCRALLLAAH